MNAMLRSCRQSFLYLLALLAFAWVSGEGFQWLLRWRAERLLSDVRSLTVNRSGWTDAQQMMKKWGQWSVPTASCTAESCTYQINLIQSLLPVLGGTPEKGLKTGYRRWWGIWACAAPRPAPGSLCNAAW
jgi:hypothetical protein